MATASKLPFGILGVEIRDFWGIKELDLSFADAEGNPLDIFVLAGPNGCGKTSVLEACLLAVNNDPKQSGSNNIRFGAKDFSIRAHLQSFAGRHYLQLTSHSRKWFSEEMQPAGIAPQVFLPTAWYFSSWRSPKLVGALEITSGRKKTLPDEETNRLARAKQFLVNAKVHAAIGKKGNASVFQDAINSLEKGWRLFFPDPDVTFTVEAVGADPNSGFDVYLTNNNDVRVAVDQLSAGQIEIFTFFASVLQAHPGPGLVVIDEPELHLDPAWHALFVRGMREFFPRTQFLIATHSPEVLIQFTHSSDACCCHRKTPASRPGT